LPLKSKLISFGLNNIETKPPTMKKSLALCTFFLAIAFTAKSQTVYASEKGEKYHTADCNLSGDATGMKLADAKKAGKSQCDICKPLQPTKERLERCTGKTADKTRCKRMTASKSKRCYQHVSVN
jgi:hypothetical protein